MIRLSTTLWLVLIAIAGGALFNVSYQVGRLETEKRALDRAIAAEERAIRVLRAEWAYLNQPSRLEPLAASLTDLAPMGGLQLAASAAGIPMPLPTPADAAGWWETRLVEVAGVPGLDLVPLPRRHPGTLPVRLPASPPAPAGDAASSPAPPAPSSASGGDVASLAAIQASFRFRPPAAGRESP